MVLVIVVEWVDDDYGVIEYIVVVEEGVEVCLLIFEYVYLI